MVTVGMLFLMSMMISAPDLKVSRVDETVQENHLQSIISENSSFTFSAYFDRNILFRENSNPVSFGVRLPLQINKLHYWNLLASETKQPASKYCNYLFYINFVNKQRAYGDYYLNHLCCLVI
jgi:hypothetical protein